MPIKVASWNSSLGLINKVEIVKIILKDYDLDVFYIHEAEITQTTPLELLKINGYNIEYSPTCGQTKSRQCCYIKNKTKYQRIRPADDVNIELIVLEILGNTLCGFYRPFLIPNHTNEMEYISDFKKCVEELPAKNLIVLGDFNIDYLKIHDQASRHYRLYNEIEDVLIEKTLVQLIKKPTWQRKHNDTLKESLLDHAYVSDLTQVERVENDKQITGDHNLIALTIKTNVPNFPRQIPKYVQDWSNYSKEKLIEKLNAVEFDQCETLDVEGHVSFINQQLGTILDELVPTIRLSRKEVPGFVSLHHIKQRRRRKNLYKKFKRTGDIQYLERSRDLERNIKRNLNESRKNKVRSRIKPGDSKTLWQAVNIAKNNLIGTLPESVSLDEKNAETDEEKAELFCKHFNDKVTNIINNNPHNRAVYNGRKLINNSNLEPFSVEELLKILNDLPNKNCSGIDRIPLRFFSDAKLVLAPTILSLMIKIWNSNIIPEVWKITKVIPLHKSGNKADVKNYRPISNLCSLSKIFEKLLLKKIEKVALLNNIDLTHKNQHGFKAKHSTITAMLEIQNEIANALDNNEYAAVTSLDLSAAFDVVNHDLLMNRLRVMGLPDKIVNLLQEWLLNRSMYVNVNGSCSIFVQILAGTLQGSCLGPILFALFTAPMHDLIECTTFADDNYTIATGKDLNETIGRVKMKSNTLINWLKDSGMQVNSSKTEFCIFFRNDTRPISIILDGEVVTSKNEMKILGVTFDAKLQWSSHVNKTLLKCKKSLQAIQLISRFFNVDEKINIITSLFYSKLYYAAEVWLVPSLKQTFYKKLLSLSTKALRIAANDQYNVFNSEDLHVMFNRFTPKQMSHYVSLLNLYRCINNKMPESTWIKLQFKSLPLTRANKTLFPSSNKRKVGLNALENRLSFVSTLITNEDLNKDYVPFKTLAKKLVLLR